MQPSSRLGKSLLAAALLRLGPKNRSRLMRRWWLSQASSLVESSGLFDSLFYTEHNPDVADNGMEPLQHYLLYGDKEGRQPMPYFDPEHYRRSLPSRIPRRFNTLLHYILVGRFMGAEVSPGFHAGFFLEQNRDVRLNQGDPLSHFSRSATRFGDHFSPFGTRKKRGRAIAPSPDAWDTLPQMPPGEPAVDVIVPVHSGYDETLRCIYQTLACRQKTNFRLVVVNDASPEAPLVEAMKHLAARGLFDLLENSANLGFVASVNRALLLHPDRDAILLNSDTEPHNNWLDRLRDAAYRFPRVATVTPLSNNATICSYPRFNVDNPGSLELEAAELDALAAVHNRGKCVDAPTGVGFCFYMRRDAISEIGILDQVSFGRGYGEENDFCCRATAAGWRNRIATDVYVWHWGSRSFKGAKVRHMAAALHAMQRRHPGYRALVESFVAADPLHESRAALDEARLLRHTAAEGNVLVLMHNRGGGAARLMAEELQALKARGIPGFVLAPERDRKHGRVSAFEMPRLPNLPPVNLTCPDDLQSLLEKLRISEIHVHQLVDFPRVITGQGTGAARSITAAARRNGIPIDFYVHDYQLICPRINLVGPSGVYCGEPDEAGCARCLKAQVKGIENSREKNIRAWRVRHASLLALARRVIVPSADVKHRLAAYFPHAHYVVRAHEPDVLFPPTREPRAAKSDQWRVVVPGALGVIKGYDVLLATAKASRAAGLPLQFILMGFSRNDAELAKAGVAITGRYKDADAEALLADIDADFAWIPSVAPETYCYAMSIPLKAGLPVVAFDLGAQAARLRSHGGRHQLLPLPLARRARKLALALKCFASAQSKLQRKEAA